MDFSIDFNSININEQIEVIPELEHAMKAWINNINCFPQFHRAA